MHWHACAVMARVFSLPWSRLLASAAVGASRGLHVCVVGSGPSGFYTTEKMLKAHGGARIDIIERLPTPFGLVRFGVAPDHPETKIVVNQFSRVAGNERCCFFGNVSLGTSISLAELREIYDVVVLAYGAESDRSLGIPGEDLNGIHSAREFVWWYNGHPDLCGMTPNFQATDSAVILGQGNVAIDVARILLRPVADLEKTDIADHALAALHASMIRRVYLVGRRGPVQAACTAKELREILGLRNVRVHVEEADLITSPADGEEMRNSRIQKRVYDLLSKAAASGKDYSKSDDHRDLHFVFFRKPTNFFPSEHSSNVGSVELEKTILKGGSGRQVAVGTSEFHELKCGLVLKSIGYKSMPVDGLPFDKDGGIVPNLKGRVLAGDQRESASVEQGLYVVGWLKRGPTGIIGTNLYCAEETVASILEDASSGSLDLASSSTKPGREGLVQMLKARGLQYVPFSGWQKIDALERAAGERRNKPREKITDWSQLLKAAASQE